MGYPRKGWTMMRGRCNGRYSVVIPILVGLFLSSGTGLFRLWGVEVKDNGISGVIASGLRSELDHFPQGGSIAVWVFFHDKGFTDRERLAEALSERRSRFSSRVLRRRSKVLGGRTVLPGDLPVCETYIGQVLSTGCTLRHRSDWLNAISVEAAPETIRKIAALPFVRRIQRVARLGRIEPLAPGRVERQGMRERGPETTGGLDYGPSFPQLEQINVPAVHDSGFSGNGVRVLMLDTGFYKDHEALATRDVLAEWDFVFNDGETQNEPEDVPDQQDHGTATWSALGGFSPGNLIGPAYNASFLLAKTEDIRSETPVEEDNYVAALEWADSLGADVASASLAYLDFDDPYQDYQYSDLDGNTAVITVAIDDASRRGILVCNAMGNWGPGYGSLWTPADADSMIACGAVYPTGLITSFSSRGPTFDGRLKPEVVAQGENTYAASASGGYRYYAGTSLSTPLVGGSAALVIEAHPDWGPMQVREALMSTAARASNPDNAYGSGLIDVLQAIYGQGVEERPSPFSLNYPVSGDSAISGSIDFQWTASSDPVGRGVSYKLLISPDTLFSDPVVIEDIHENSYTLTDSLAEGTYFWKVYAGNTQGFYRESDDVQWFYAIKPTGIWGGRPPITLPRAVVLHQNVPNPFNPRTVISFDLPERGGSVQGGRTTVSLLIFDVRGRLVRTLLREGLEGGSYRVSWDGRDDSGRALPSGVYLYRLDTGAWSSTRKMVMTK